MTTSAFDIASHSAAASAPRQFASRLALSLGFSEERAGQVALVASELATNIAKHAAAGQMLIQQSGSSAEPVIEVIAIDKGPGIPERALGDGYSTSGSLGAGLGAVRRLSDDSHFFSRPDGGTVAVGRVWRNARSVSRATCSGICVPKPGESISGDAWEYHDEVHKAAIIVVDGLGHGPQAAEASAAATGIFRGKPRLSPASLVAEIHDALRATRGAAVAIAVLDRDRHTLRFAGVGNISAAIVVPQRPRHSLTSLNGTVGHVMRQVQEFTYPVAEGAVLVMHSDGLATHWDPEMYNGVWQRDPALAAAVLYRDHARGRDDCTVVVARL